VGGDEKEGRGERLVVLDTSGVGAHREYHRSPRGGYPFEAYLGNGGFE